MSGFLTKNQLLAYLQPSQAGVKPLIENMVDPGVQIQPAGIDLSLQKIFSFETAAVLAFTQAQTTLPTYRELPFDEPSRFFCRPPPVNFFSTK